MIPGTIVRGNITLRTFSNPELNMKFKRKFIAWPALLRTIIISKKIVFEIVQNQFFGFLSLKCETFYSKISENCASQMELLVL